MTDEEFNDFLTQAVFELSAKQDALSTTHGLGRFARWHFDQQAETLVFFDAQGREALVADVIDIGSFATNACTWR